MSKTISSPQWSDGTDWTRSWLPDFLRQCSDEELERIRSFLSGQSDGSQFFIEDVFEATAGHLAEMTPMIEDITGEDCDVIEARIDELRTAQPEEAVDTQFLQAKFADADRERFIVLVCNLATYLKGNAWRDNVLPSWEFESLFRPMLVQAGYWEFIGPLLDAEMACRCPDFSAVEDVVVFAQFPHDENNLPLNALDITTKRCKECRGTGKSTRCQRCFGVGQIEEYDDIFVVCPECKKSGRVAAHKCTECDGHGTLRRYPVEMPCSCRGEKDSCLLCEGTGMQWSLQLLSQPD